MEQIGALTVYYILKYNPAKAKQIICSSDEYLKYMPIDKNTSSFISHTGFHQNRSGGELEGENRTVLVSTPIAPPEGHNYAKVKRSVSETKKSSWRQGRWHCGTVIS
jgi:hypothetical protein